MMPRGISHAGWIVAQPSLHGKRTMRISSAWMRAWQSYLGCGLCGLEQNYGATSAPLIVKDKVLVGPRAAMTACADSSPPTMH